MNEQLQKELAAWLSKIREGAEAAGSFVLEQAPLVVQEKVMFGRVFHTVETMLLAVAFVALVYGCWKFGNMARRNDFGEAGWFVPAVACTIAGIATFHEGVYYALPQALKVWFAPRLYVLEWLTGLVK
jgi:hypothetical protein